MALEVCPHCQKKKPKQHQRFCSSNPSRVSGPGRPKTQAAGTPPATDESSQAVQAMIEADIGIEATEREPETMPDLEPEPQAPPPAPVVSQAPIITPILVETLCSVVDAAIKGQLPDHLPAGCPQMPGPVTDAEKKTLSAVAEPVVAKYLPLLDTHPELALLAVAVIVFAPRFIAARNVAAWCEKHKNTPAPQLQRAPAAPQPRPEVLDDAALLALGDRSLAEMQRLGGQG